MPKRGKDLSNDEIIKRLHRTIGDSTSVEMAVLRLMEEFYFDLDVVKASLAEKGLNVSFSNVKYRDIASFVGLDSVRMFNDATLFDLRRSRIPTTLFKNIVLDMDVLLIQYGPPAEQSDAEARSRFLAPIVNHLIAQFGSSFQNMPRSVMAGLVTTRGRVEYHFKTFAGAISVVFVEAKFRIGDPEERLDAIAQVIAECDACDWKNTRAGFNVPVYSILCDGTSFLFFAFDGTINPYKFTMGVVPGRRFRGLKLVDFSSEPTARPFIHSLRSICETLFNLLLCAYIANLKAFRDRVASQHGQRKSLDGCDTALKFAEEALEKSQDAEVLRQENSIVDADATAEAAFEALKLRYSFSMN
ncbi:hypothetical protein EDB83DRAFT_2220190 [Lactarius deliciosus]|nr:hypothetical protein EDB83DRAFT_2220190 [Lactarius deliciosus]